MAVAGYGTRIAPSIAMKPLKCCFFLIALLAAGALSGCSSGTPKSADVAGPIRQALGSAGIKDVSVSQDRDKGVVTLGGHVTAEAAKAQAESIAASLAQGQVVANEIAIVTPGVESQAKAINEDVDKGIEKNLDAALIQNGLNKQIKYQVRNGVITLTGQVD
jgi:osmotically-inducible protein OsmY